MECVHRHYFYSLLRLKRLLLRKSFCQQTWGNQVYDQTGTDVQFSWIIFLRVISLNENRKFVISIHESGIVITRLLDLLKSVCEWRGRVPKIESDFIIKWYVYSCWSIFNGVPDISKEFGVLGALNNHVLFSIHLIRETQQNFENK